MSASKKTYTEAELKSGFKKLMMGEFWQGRICSQIRDKDLNLVLEAIKFYTGSEALVYKVPGGDYKVMADGYRDGPWGKNTPERDPR